jgi:hypothetical protein
MLKDSNRILRFVLSEIFLSSSRIGRSETAKILRSVAMTSLVLSTFVTPELRASRSIVTVSFDILIYIVVTHSHWRSLEVLVVDKLLID